MPFSFHSDTVANCRVFHFKGSFIDSSDDRQLVNEFHELLDEGEKSFIFDFKDLEYINSSGINELVKMVNRVNQSKGNLVFVAVPEKIQELLKIIKLNSVLTIRESIDEGVAAIKANE
ncbi:STAS domain-containing protein [Halocola ammonii]